jgi:hypothetical protein
MSDPAVSSGTPTLTVWAEPDVVSAGDSTTLNWSSTAATSCTARGGWSGVRAVSGSQTIADLRANTTFGLTCVGPDGLVSAGTDVQVVFSSIPSFPGAQGHGALATGGRGGRVIQVTNLNADGPGSLKAAIKASGPRIVVFRVAGEIILDKTTLKIRNPYITIAGQTAPGDGITLRSRSGDNTGALLRLEGYEDAEGAHHQVHDVIIQHLKLRLGKGRRQTDNITINDASRVIVDHCSLQWATDESVGMVSDADESVFDVTIQRSILAATLEPHATAMLISRSGDTRGALSRISVHHNLFAHNTHRNPRVTATERVEPITIPAQVQVINNVVYNWSDRVGNTKANVLVDLVGNYLHPGPMSRKRLRHNAFRHEHVGSQISLIPLPDPSLFVAGNLQSHVFKDPNEDNWKLMAYHYLHSGEPLPLEWRRRTRRIAAVPITVQSATDAFASVIADVGANKRLNADGTFTRRIDVVDQAIFDNVRLGTGPAAERDMDHQDDFGGYPRIDPAVPYADTDRDGMADVYEKRRGFDPRYEGDGREDADDDGYTNLEEFLNGTDPLDDRSPDITVPSKPQGLSARALSEAQMQLSWTASSDNVGVAGYRILRDGGVIDSTMKTVYTDTQPANATGHIYTVQAFDAEGNTSSPSDPANASAVD